MNRRAQSAPVVFASLGFKDKWKFLKDGQTMPH